MFEREHFRHHWRRERMFQKGDFKYLLLELLKDKPRHGYEMIRELEERFHGFYSPSPGIVYPTLQYLEEMGYVTSQDQDGKKVYSITEAGRKHLAEQSEAGGFGFSCWPGFESGRHGWEFWGPEFQEQFRDAMDDVREIGRLVGRRARAMDKDKLRRIGEILKRAYEEIETIVKEEPRSAV